MNGGMGERRNGGTNKRSTDHSSEFCDQQGMIQTMVMMVDWHDFTWIPSGWVLVEDRWASVALVLFVLWAQCHTWTSVTPVLLVLWARCPVVHWYHVVYVVCWAVVLICWNYNRLTLIPTWITNHMLSKVWDEIIYQFPNFNGFTVEVWEWINNFIPYFLIGVITYPCWDWT